MIGAAPPNVPPRARCAPGASAVFAELVSEPEKGGPMHFDTIRQAPQENTTISIVTSLAIVLTTLAAVIGPLFAA